MDYTRLWNYMTEPTTFIKASKLTPGQYWFWPSCGRIQYRLLRVGVCFRLGLACPPDVDFKLAAAPTPSSSLRTGTPPFLRTICWTARAERSIVKSSSCSREAAKTRSSCSRCADVYCDTSPSVQ